MIQVRLAQAIREAIEAAQTSGALPPFEIPAIEMERPARKEHGDWSTGMAMAVAKAAEMQPRQIAERIVVALGTPEHVAKVEVAGPGFVNFTLSHSWLTSGVREVEEAGDSWGRSRVEEPEKIQVEFVSANPTGPMHIGHARWAAVGDTLARTLEWTGHTVEREFYINNYGGQMAKFGRSLAIRYLELFGRRAPAIPEGGYPGDEVRELAAEIVADVGERSLGLPEEERDEFFRREGERRMVQHHRNTLDRFGVRFDVWFSEVDLHASGAVDRVFEMLEQLGHIFESEGTVWLRSTDFGDYRDRPLKRSTDGTWIYIVPDLAYFLDKLRRGFERIVYLWGADHQDHIPEMKAGILALGEDLEHCEFLVGQFVNLLRGGQIVRIGKRRGEYVTFDELLDEVGVDAARYTFLRQSIDTTMNVDLDLVVSQTLENPVYYVQYSHARICSIMRKAAEAGVEIAPVATVALEELQHESEQDLLRKIWEFPEAVDVAARLRAPHRLTKYAEDLAALFNAFYRDCRVISEDASLTQARLHLAEAARITLRNVLTLLGVGAPEQM